MTVLSNKLLLFINIWIERLLFKFIRRKRQNREYLTNHSDEFIKMAMKLDCEHSSFYHKTPFVESRDFHSIGIEYKKGVRVERINYIPRFYYPRHVDMYKDDSYLYNEITVYSRIGLNSRVVLVLLNAWGVKETTDSDHKLARKLASNYGISVVLSTLPLHRRRTPSTFESGELALNGDSSACLRSFKQAVEELLAIAKYFKQDLNYNIIGVGGISLGGTIAAVASNLVPFDFGIQIFSSGNLADIVWDSPRLSFLKQQFIKGGVNRTLLKRHWKVIDPVTFLPDAKTRNIQLIIGRADTVIPWHVSSDYSNMLLKERLINTDIYISNFSHYTGIYFAHHLDKVIGDYIMGVLKSSNLERKENVWETDGQKQEKYAFS